VQIEIRPDPSEGERAAIEVALRELAAEVRPAAWWEAGLAENLGEPESER
jgi:hypothetical protein